MNSKPTKMAECTEHCRQGKYERHFSGKLMLKLTSRGYLKVNES